MKITVKMEDGAPILFFPTEPANAGRVLCYARVGEHSEASRAYMRGLPAPTTKNEFEKAWRLIAQYAQQQEYLTRL